MGKELDFIIIDCNFYFKIRHIHSHLYKIDFINQMINEEIISNPEHIANELGIQIEATQIHLCHHSLCLHAKGLFLIDNTILLKVKQTQIKPRIAN